MITASDVLEYVNQITGEYVSSAYTTNFITFSYKVVDSQIAGISDNDRDVLCTNLAAFYTAKAAKLDDFKIFWELYEKLLEGIKQKTKSESVAVAYDDGQQVSAYGVRAIGKLAPILDRDWRKL